MEEHALTLALPTPSHSRYTTLLSDIEGHHFLKPWAHYFNPTKPLEGAMKTLEILKELDNQGDFHTFENQWKAAATLRQTWGTPAMTASYADTFESR